MTARMNLLSGLVLAAGLLGTFMLMGIGDGQRPSPLAWLWAALPYLVLALTTHFLARTPARQLVMLAAATGVALAGVGLLLDAIVLRPDPLAHVMLLLLPAYQLVLAVAALLVVSVLTLRRPVPPLAGRHS